MTTPAQTPVRPAEPHVPQFGTAGVFLEHLARHDFPALGATLEPDVTLSALLPRGLRQWSGRDGVQEAFEGWFGDVDSYELVDADIGEVGSRLHLRWRLRVTAARLGPGAWLVEQQVYADTDTTGRIAKMNLLCSGFCRERAATD